MEIEWNTVKYIDCMDEKEGLPSLPDKSIDLCLTDPPYNQKFKPGLNSYNNKSNKKRKAFQDDMNPQEYQKWCYEWFDELKRICNMIIFTPGYKNKQIWFEKEEFEILIWYNNYKSGMSKIAKLNVFEPILCYGRLNFFMRSVFHYNYGFNMEFDDLNCIHPTPKPKKLYRWIIEQMKPISVIDPFLGSGTTAEVCTKLGIPWIGYEILEEYSVDIEKRLKNCKKEPQQISLEVFK